MDADLLKLALSVLSAVVAVASAVIAYRTRKQTRLDLFETQRDVLLLAMSENDIRLKTLLFKISLLGTRLLDASRANPARAAESTRHFVDALSDLDGVVRGLQAREWTEDQVRQTSYAEHALLELRRRTLQEQVTGKTIQSEAHAVLLQEAQAELERLGGTR